MLPRPAHRWEDSRPAHGLILERYARDLGPQARPSEDPAGRWNLDHAWFTREEARAWLPADPQSGQRVSMPTASLQRLLRFSLVDNVRGQTLPFGVAEIVRAKLEIEVVRRAGDRVFLRMTGHSLCLSDGSWHQGDNLWQPRRQDPHALEATLLGSAEFDLGSGTFRSLEWVALARRAGRAGVNGRARDAGAGRLGFYLRLAAADGNVAPAFIALYDQPWVAMPTSGRELRR